MKFEVILTQEARQELFSLDYQYQQPVKDDYTRIQNDGIQDVETKLLRDDIFEIKSGRVRSLYGYKEGKQVIVTVVFLKKSQKTPNKYIILAKERLENYGK